MVAILGELVLCTCWRYGAVAATLSGLVRRMRWGCGAVEVTLGALTLCTDCSPDEPVDGILAAVVAETVLVASRNGGLGPGGPRPPTTACTGLLSWFQFEAIQHRCLLQSGVVNA